MSMRRLPSLLFVAVLAGCASGNDDGTRSFHLGVPHIGLPHFGTPEFLKDHGIYRGEMQRVAEAGRPVLLWGDVSLTPECAIAGDTRLEVIAQPTHGFITVDPGRLYAVYPEGDRRSVCSGRLVDGVLAHYTAERAYAGVDQAVLRGVTSEGEVHEVTVDITVQPAKLRTRAPIHSQAAPAPAAAPTPLPSVRQRPISPDAPAPAVVQSPYPGE